MDFQDSCTSATTCVLVIGKFHNGVFQDLSSFFKGPQGLILMRICDVVYSFASLHAQRTCETNVPYVSWSPRVRLHVIGLCNVAIIE